MEKFFEKFRLGEQKEDFAIVIKNIDSGVVFRGTNLWILIFAIFVASLGLNVNSTAVIIGAMLISPLMGPIMGIGMAVGINDLELLRKSIYNYVIATGVALVTSTVFFLISPLNEAHSELLARTSPTIYDVLIALFGGFAGIVAVSSRHKGNILPGVAIATALMPPLCTAGYGLATLQLNFFNGAFYLFIINTVFISLATFLFARLFHFPYKLLKNQRADKIAQRVVWLVVMLTLMPSIYFGFDLIRQDRFFKNATKFIANETHFPNDYLLNKKIDAKKNNILLVFGGKELLSQEIEKLKLALKKYDLDKATLEIKQGFAYLSQTDGNSNIAQTEQAQLLTLALETKEKENVLYRAVADSISKQQKLSSQVFAELKVQYPLLKEAVIQPATVIGESTRTRSGFLVLLYYRGFLGRSEKNKIENWLQIRLQQDTIRLIFKQ